MAKLKAYYYSRSHIFFIFEKIFPRGKHYDAKSLCSVVQNLKPVLKFVIIINILLYSKVGKMSRSHIF